MPREVEVSISKNEKKILKRLFSSRLEPRWLSSKERTYIRNLWHKGVLEVKWRAGGLRYTQEGAFREFYPTYRISLKTRPEVERYLKGKTDKIKITLSEPEFSFLETFGKALKKKAKPVRIRRKEAIPIETICRRSGIPKKKAVKIARELASRGFIIPIKKPIRRETINQVISKIEDFVKTTPEEELEKNYQRYLDVLLKGVPEEKIKSFAREMAELSKVPGITPTKTLIKIISKESPEVGVRITKNRMRMLEKIVGFQIEPRPLRPRKLRKKKRQMKLERFGFKFRRRR